MIGDPGPRMNLLKAVLIHIHRMDRNSASLVSNSTVPLVQELLDIIEE